MNKKELILPFMVIGLTLLFAGICMAVFLSNGKSRKWVARKMKIGGLLLTLTAASCNGGGEVMCYETVALNSMYIPGYDGTSYKISLDTSNTITGHIYERRNDDFSFLVIDNDKNKLQQGKLMAQDGSFDSPEENFIVELNKDLAPGEYTLQLFSVGIAEQDSTAASNFINLVIE